MEVEKLESGGHAFDSETCREDTRQHLREPPAMVVALGMRSEWKPAAELKTLTSRELVPPIPGTSETNYKNCRLTKSIFVCPYDQDLAYRISPGLREVVTSVCYSLAATTFLHLSHQTLEQVHFHKVVSVEQHILAMEPESVDATITIGSRNQGMHCLLTYLKQQNTTESHLDYD